MDREWTKQEMMMIKQPALMLAHAVIYQWQLDGCPKSDEEAITYWEGIIQNFREVYNED